MSAERIGLPSPSDNRSFRNTDHFRQFSNDLVSTAVTAGALFGLPVLAAKIEHSLHAAQNQPLAYKARG
jgi:hypothetical protein